METAFLRLDEVIEIHTNQIRLYGRHIGVRDIESLKSAIAMPAVTFGGEYLQSGAYEMAAAYLFHIVRNHPFVDGNKRTGAMASFIFLTMNGIALDADEDSFAEMALSMAEGKTDKAAIARFFRKHSRPTESSADPTTGM